MRIISPFKDYYDSAQAYGVDPNIFYHRIPKPLNLSLSQYLPRTQVPPSSVGWKRGIATTATIILCGKVYYFCIPEGLVEEEPFEIFSKQLSSPLTLGYEGCRNRIIHSHQNAHRKQRLLQLDIYWNAIQNLNGKEVVPAIHQVANSPVIFTADLLHSYYHTPLYNLVVVNPRLANFGFQTILDPFTCFQEIAQYLGNELAQPDIAPLRTGDDETILRAKGFDEQSFRTAAPGHKKLNRKINRARKKKPD